MDNSALLPDIISYGVNFALKRYAKAQREAIYLEAVRGERGEPPTRPSDRADVRAMDDNDYIRIKASLP